jgi:hypothetical protein
MVDSCYILCRSNEKVSTNYQSDFRNCCFELLFQNEPVDTRLIANCQYSCTLWCYQLSTAKNHYAILRVKNIGVRRSPLQRIKGWRRYKG